MYLNRLNKYVEIYNNVNNVKNVNNLNNVDFVVESKGKSQIEIVIVLVEVN